MPGQFDGIKVRVLDQPVLGRTEKGAQGIVHRKAGRLIKEAWIFHGITRSYGSAYRSASVRSLRWLNEADRCSFRSQPVHRSQNAEEAVDDDPDEHWIDR